MKSIDAIQQEISNLEHSLSELRKKSIQAITKEERRTIRFQDKRLVLLRSLLKYLQTQPTEDFVKKQYKETVDKIKVRERAFVAPPETKPTIVNKLKTKFLKELGVPKLREMKSNLSYLLAE